MPKGWGIQTNIKSQVIPSIQQLVRQIPYVQMLAVNQIADEFQKVEQNSLTKQGFTLRQETFIKNTIKRVGPDFATKQHPVAAVRIDPERDFLAKFERGGIKVALQGKPFVAIPSPGLRRNKRGLIPRKFYPSKFKPFVDHPSGITTGQDRTFIVPTKGGNRLLLQRFGGSRGKRGVRPLYLFVPEVHISPQLHFYDNALAVARSAWPSAVAAAWARAIKTMR
jgi:hypothetical protein